MCCWRQHSKQSGRGSRCRSSSLLCFLLYVLLFLVVGLSCARTFISICLFTKSKSPEGSRNATNSQQLSVPAALSSNSSSSSGSRRSAQLLYECHCAVAAQHVHVQLYSTNIIVGCNAWSTTITLLLQRERRLQSRVII